MLVSSATERSGRTPLGRWAYGGGHRVDETDLTAILRKAREGDPAARQALLPLVYQELRSIAQGRMGAATGHTLQPTALVHEAYLRSLKEDQSFESRRHFFFVAARAMRDILVEHARRKAAEKRGGAVEHIVSDEVAEAIEAPMEDMLALNEALEALEEDHDRPHQVVMLRFFGGLSNAATAELLGVTPRTAARDWEFARAFLFSKLSDAEA